MCPNCEVELERDTICNDYFAPNVYDGHGQDEIPVMSCPSCDYYEDLN